eukprot:753838-Hanusia_phi.AAC.2
MKNRNTNKKHQEDQAQRSREQAWNNPLVGNNSVHIPHIDRDVSVPGVGSEIVRDPVPAALENIHQCPLCRPVVDPTQVHPNVMFALVRSRHHLRAVNSCKTSPALAGPLPASAMQAGRFLTARNLGESDKLSITPLLPQSFPPVGQTPAGLYSSKVTNTSPPILRHRSMKSM